MIITLVGAGAAVIQSVPAIFKGDPGEVPTDLQQKIDEVLGYNPVPSDSVQFIPASSAIPNGYFLVSQGTVGGVELIMIQKGNEAVLEILVPPTSSSDRVPVGENVNLTYGSYNNLISVSGQLIVDGVNRFSEVTDMVWSPGPNSVGSVIWRVTALGAGNQRIVTDVPLTVYEVVTLDSISNVLIDADSVYGGTASEVTSITTRGTNPVNINGVMGAPTVPVTKVVDGFKFGFSRYLSLTGATISSADGIMLFVEYTRSVKQTGAVVPFRVSGTNFATVRFNENNNVWSYQYNAGATANLDGPAANANAFALGDKIQAAIYVDRVNATVSYYDPVNKTILTQAITSPTAALSFNQIAIGHNFDGIVHKVNVVYQPAGQAAPITFEDAVNQFAEVVAPPVTASTASIVDSDGQSLELGANSGASIAPNGTRYRDLFKDPSVQMLGGLVRSDDVAIANTAMPLLKGYDHLTNTTGLTTALVAGNIPIGNMLSHMMVRDGVIEDIAIHQFHGAGGQSVLNFNSDPLDGDDRTILWENRDWWYQQIARVRQSTGMTITTDRYFWQQGEADVGMARGAYETAFDKLHAEKVALIRASTGQDFDPRIFMYQTGGYMRKVGTQSVALDQNDIIRKYNGVMIGPNWQWPIADANVHFDQIGYQYMAELATWAALETKSGNAWNLIPATSVTRSGNRITIPIPVRPGETLVSETGKYANYGGDPANMGIAVEGGGTVTNITLQGGNILVDVAGTVTAVHNAYPPISTDFRSNLDENGYGYAAHRSTIRTSLTKEVNSYGGHNFTLKRFVPTFWVNVT